VTKERLKKLIGQRIVELRTKKGWTQAELASESSCKLNSVKEGYGYLFKKMDNYSVKLM